MALQVFSMTGGMVGKPLPSTDNLLSKNLPKKGNPILVQWAGSDVIYVFQSWDHPSCVWEA